MTTPASATILANGRLQLTWSSGDISSIPNTVNANRLPLQYGMPNVAGGLLPVHASDQRRGKLVGSPGNSQPDARHTIVLPRTHKSEISVVVNRNTSGASGSGAIVFTTPGSLPFITFVGGGTNTVGSNTLNLTNNYIGQTTDIRLQDVGDTVNAVPDVSTDNGNGSETTITFRFSGNRVARIKSGRLESGARINVAGGSHPGVTGLSAIVGTVPVAGTANIGLRFPFKVRPGQSVALQIDDGTFEISQHHDNGGTINFANALDCIASSNIIISSNNRTWSRPTFVNATIHNTGTRIRLNMNDLISVVGGGPGPLTFSGRTATYVSVTGQYIEYAIPAGNPVYRGEMLSGFSTVAANVIRTRDADSTGNNLAFTVEAFTVANDTGAAAPPALVLNSAAVDVFGTILTLVWSRAATRGVGSAVLQATNSPVGSQSLGIPVIGGNIWTFTLSSDAIRIGDNVAGVFFDNSVMDGITGLSIGTLPYAVTNGSTQPYPKPLIVPNSFRINPNGTSGKLVFDMRVVIGSNFVTAVRILARDITSGILSVFTPTNLQLATTTVAEDSVSFDLTSGGTIFGNMINGAGHPNDGDDVRVHSFTAAGVVRSRLSVDVGHPVNLDPIGTNISSETDFVNAIPFGPGGNASTQQEPVNLVVPAYTLAVIYDSSNEQFIRIRFNADVQRGTVLPTLVSAFVGPISLVFHTIQNDGDEIVYRVVGNKVIRDDDGEVATLTLPIGVVVSAATGTANILTGPYNDGTNSFVNSSTVVQPPEILLPPIAQQVIIGIDGLKVGIYFDSQINAVAGTVTVKSLISGDKQAGGLFTQNTLLTAAIVGVVPIFRGEHVETSIPANLVSGATTGQPNIKQSLVADNNSTIAKPRPPVIDSVVLNALGNLLVVTYDVPVVPGEGTGYTLSSKSGRNAVTVNSISGNVANVDVAGIDYETETVDLYLAADFVKEAKYQVVSSAVVIKRIVDVTATQPTLPTNESGLT